MREYASAVGESSSLTDEDRNALFSYLTEPQPLGELASLTDEDSKAMAGEV